MREFLGFTGTGSSEAKVGSAPKRGLLSRFKAKASRSGAPMTGDFARDEKGAIHLMTAFLAVPLVISVAVAIDTAELYRAQQNFQQATDAAVLVTTNMFAGGSTPAEAEEAGKRVFDANMSNLGMSSGGVNFTFPGDCETGVITAKADGIHPMFFPGIHGLGSAANGGGAAIPVEAAAQCPNTSFEVAMVLDTSGSMNDAIAGDPNSSPKIETLRTAATQLVTDLFAAGQNIPKAKPVQFAVIPFSGMVNVGYGNRNQAWMDKQGKSSIHHQDLNWSWDTARNPQAQANGGWKNGNTGQWLTRMTLFDDLNVRWGGCLQARPYPHSVKDTAPDTTQPDTLFVPAFAPDEPERLNGYQTMRDASANRPFCRRWKYRSRRDRTIICKRWSDGRRGSTNNAGNPTVPSYNDGYYYRNGVYQFQLIEPAGYNISGEGNFINDYLYDDRNMPTDNECRGSIFHEKCSGPANQLKRQDYTFKYANGSVSNASSTRGPNYSCSARPLLSLSDNETTVNNMINGLNARGSTNVTQGAAWGWRTLSSGQPFQGRAETERDNRKIMIVMTDGQNTYYNPANWGYSGANRTTYNGFGYGKHDDGVNRPNDGDGFMFDGFDKYANPGQNNQTYTEAMDDHLLKVCKNAKDTGVTIYSIAFDVADGSSIKTTLEACASPQTASGEQFYYDASDSAKLTEAFQKITNSIRKLKLVQ